MIQKVKTGETGTGELNCVFVIIYCIDAQPYLNYIEVKKLRGRELIVPMALMQLRWDSSIGFPGGKVEESDKIDGILTRESLLNALIREMEEEISIVRSTINLDKFKELCTFKDLNSNCYIHNFIYPVTFNELKDIYKNSIMSKHILSENSGSVVVHLKHYDNKKGINTLLKHSFSGTALNELLEFIKLKDIEKLI